MPTTHTLLLHGYSDCSSSFRSLKRRLREHDIGTVDTIYYGDYESREDNITFNDVIDGLNDRMIEKGLIDHSGGSQHDLNIIVHSTGGLVIRHWLWRYYRHRLGQCPVKRIVMLAPANFGSPLAHRGKSFLGRLVKGRWKIGDLLEVGRNLLDGLELASPWQWELAHRDLFIPEGSYFNRHQIQLTILVGIEDYSGIMGWVNKPGTDGTVVIAGTPLNSVKLRVGFCDPENPYEWQETRAADDFSFGVLPELNHGSIVDDFDDAGSQITTLTGEALKIESAQSFAAFKQKLAEITRDTYQTYQEKDKIKYSCYQQFIIRAVDDQNEAVRDYTLEFYVYKADKAANSLIDQSKYFNRTERQYSEKFQELIISEIHTHKTDPSYRRLLVNQNKLQDLINEAHEALGPFVLSLKIFVPKIDKGIYYDVESLQNVVIYRSDGGTDNQPSLFFDNTTTLIELKVDRKTSYVTLTKSPKNH